MTNEQFAFVLNQLYVRLAEAIERALDALPKEAIRTEKNILGEDVTYAPALAPITLLADEIRRNAASLAAR